MEGKNPIWVSGVLKTSVKLGFAEAELHSVRGVQIICESLIIPSHLRQITYLCSNSVKFLKRYPFCNHNTFEIGMRLIPPF